MNIVARLKTGVLFGVTKGEITHVPYNLPVPAMFRLIYGGVTLFNASEDEEDTVTMTTPYFNHQRPRSVTVNGRRGVDVTNILTELASNDTSEIYITANKSTSPDILVCAGAVKLPTEYNKEVYIGEYITITLVDSYHILLKSYKKPFRRVSEINIKHTGDSEIRICDGLPGG